MDPNVLLANLLRISATLLEKIADAEDPELTLSDAINAHNSGAEEWDPVQDISNLAAGVKDLNDWIARGGFLPGAWSSKQQQLLLGIGMEDEETFEERVVAIMYPPDDPMADWSSDTLEEIKNLMDERGLTPQYYHDAFDASFASEDDTE